MRKRKEKIAVSACLVVAIAGCTENLRNNHPTSAIQDSRTVETVDSKVYKLRQVDPKTPSFSWEKPIIPQFLPTSKPLDAAVASHEIVPIQNDVAPTFDDKPSAEKIRIRLSDGAEHQIAVLFHDNAKIRSVKGRGVGLIDEGDRGLISNSGTDLASVEKILEKHKCRKFPLYSLVDSETEEERERDISEVRQKRGWNMPNRASWTVLALDKYTPEAAEDLLGVLNSNDLVRVAEPLVNSNPSAPTYTVAPPSDPKFPTSWAGNDFNSNTQTQTDVSPIEGVNWWWWNRHSIGGAWTKNKGDTVSVAVIDTGFHTAASRHDGVSYILGNARHFYNGGSDTNISPPGSPTDEYYIHGSLVTSFVAAREGNGIGLSGAAPRANVIPIRVNEVGVSANIVSALNFSWATGAKIVNLSFATADAANSWNPENDVVFRQAFLEVYNHGSLLVYAAGNAGVAANNTTGKIPKATNPAYYSHALFVGSIDYRNSYAQSSCFGPRVDMAAGGDNVANTVNIQTSGGNVAGRGVMNTSGTSFAAPIVSGAAAIVSRYVSDVDKIRDILIYTSDIAASQRNGTFNNDREMSSNSNGAEGWGKIRVLHAEAAAKVAYEVGTNTHPFVVYRPSSDDYAQIKRVDGVTYSVGTNYGSNPNHLISKLPNSSIETWEYKYNGGAYAGSTSVFKYGRIYASRISGAPHLQDASGNWKQPVWFSTPVVNPSASPYNGWVNGQSYVLN